SRTSLAVSRSAVPQCGPGAFHPPHAESIAEPLAGHIATAGGQLAVGLLAAKHLVQEVDVPRRQLERLDLTQLVRGQRRDDLPQLGERVVKRLSPLPLPHVGEDPLVL
ncbi:hypothetical protein EGW08_013906, partial [Elysia chlorotica]